MTRGATVLLAAAAALAAAVGGFVAYRQFAAPPPPPPAPPAAVAVPAVRPVFALLDAAGKSRSITEWDGKALAINFWATWCPPCRREIPMLNDLHRRHAADGFEVVGIAVDFRESVLEYLQKTPVAYPILIGEQDGLDAARAFGMESMGFPFTIFTDRQGRILTVHVGELHAPEAEAIVVVINGVDAGEVSLEAARARIRDIMADRKARAGS